MTELEKMSREVGAKVSIDPVLVMTLITMVGQIILDCLNRKTPAQRAKWAVKHRPRKTQRKLEAVCEELDVPQEQRQALISEVKRQCEECPEEQLNAVLRDR